ncbi:MAG: L,D-transpeptidase family protein [Planctomycetales bacterium]|nr:L,D-transpeptidase family protein [Planctomycetales bacterium]
MQTVKTAVVVVLLLGVLYGVYTVLNTPETELPELQWPTASTAQPPVIDLGPNSGGGDAGMFSSPADIAAHPNHDHGSMPHHEAGSASPTGSAVATDSQHAMTSFGNQQASYEVDASSSYAPANTDADSMDATISPATNASPAMTATKTPSVYGSLSPPEIPAAGASTVAASDSGSSSPRSIYDSPASLDPPTTSSAAAAASRDSVYASPTDASSTPPVSAYVDTSGATTATPDVATADVAPPTDSAADASPNSIGVRAFQNARRTAETHIANGNYREALFTLSIFYNSPDLTPDEQQQLIDMLDPLAGKVIYSTEHLITTAHKVGREEDLFQVAERHQVPWQLLANINGIDDPRVLVPGTELKIIPGPFRADVDLARGELTLFANRLYAGRFPITMGTDPAPQPGTYDVRDKQRDRAYYSADGRSFPPGDSQNPFGSVWLDLGNGLAIHGSPAGSNTNQGLGCISLSPRDANDVYGILSIGSKVIIR